MMVSFGQTFESVLSTPTPSVTVSGWNPTILLIKALMNKEWPVRCMCLRLVPLEILKF